MRVAFNIKTTVTKYFGEWLRSSCFDEKSYLEKYQFLSLELIAQEAESSLEIIKIERFLFIYLFLVFWMMTFDNRQSKDNHDKELSKFLYI